ncbi:MAG: glycoside hydrolase family 3 N-terminal domain-containing protein [Solirubrobacteraceae bacterium]
MRARPRQLRTLAITAIVAGAAGATAAATGVFATPAPVVSSAAQATRTSTAEQAAVNRQIPLPASTAKLLGQRIMVGFAGSAANAELLRRVRQGRVGAVVLFGANIVNRAQVTALTQTLQRAARQGANPPLLIAVDQEGGEVQRFRDGPPDRSPPQIAATGRPAVALHEGVDTGRYLKARGVNMDLAPVSDVPTSRSAFISQQGRAFSFRPATVARYAAQFALGLQLPHVAATAKHFPGLGSAGISTDSQRSELHPSRSQLAAALKPYETLIPRGVDAIMVSTAGFPAYDRSGASAALSPRVIGGLLRGKLKFGGVVITDSLGAPTGHDGVTAGVLAARAGADILLYPDDGSGVLPALEADFGRGRIARADAEAAYRRIVALKRRVAGG